MIKVNSKRPLIGIVPDYKKGAQGAYSTRDFYALRANYIEMINEAGGAALMLSYDYDLIDDYLESLDGVMVVGGYFDIHPKYYGEEIHPEVKLNKIREEFELKFGKIALEANIPFLGICNGMQLINVLHGGGAIQHVPDEKDENGEIKYLDHEQSHSKGFEDYATVYHDVLLEKDSKLFEFVGEDKIKTNSSHHQAVRTVGKGLNISARAEDGIIEGIEDPNHPYLMGIQWHPEFGTTNADNKILESFVGAAKSYKEGK